MIDFFNTLNWKQHTAFGVVYLGCYALCYNLTILDVSLFSQSCLGMLDNGPLIYLGLLGLDPEGPLIKWFNGLSPKGPWLEWLKNPVFVTVFISALLNTLTDGFGALGDPTSSFIGVVFGCLSTLVIFPIVWRLRSINASR